MNDCTSGIMRAASGGGRPIDALPHRGRPRVREAAEWVLPGFASWAWNLIECPSEPP